MSSVYKKYFWLAGKVAKAHERNFYECLSNKSFSHYRCAEATLPFSAVAQRLKIGGLEHD